MKALLDAPTRSTYRTSMPRQQYLPRHMCTSVFNTRPPGSGGTLRCLPDITGSTCTSSPKYTSQPQSGRSHSSVKGLRHRLCLLFCRCGSRTFTNAH